jgi:hypothetical protein
VQVLIGINMIGDVRDHRVVSPAGAFAPVNFMAPVEDHVMGATILWTLIFAALAVFSIRRRTRRDLRGGWTSPAAGRLRRPEREPCPA